MTGEQLAEHDDAAHDETKPGDTENPMTQGTNNPDPSPTQASQTQQGAPQGASQGSQSRAASPDQAPDTARSYERAKPDAEAGMGRLDHNAAATPTNRRDSMPGAATNQQPPRQLNADDVVNESAASTPGAGEGARAARSPEAADHSMKEEEPDGWDQAPDDVQDPQRRRHSRTEGKGGTP